MLVSGRVRQIELTAPASQMAMYWLPRKNKHSIFGTSAIDFKPCGIHISTLSFWIPPLSESSLKAVL